MAQIPEKKKPKTKDQKRKEEALARKQATAARLEAIVDRGKELEVDRDTLKKISEMLKLCAVDASGALQYRPQVQTAVETSRILLQASGLVVVIVTAAIGGILVDAQVVPLWTVGLFAATASIGAMLALGSATTARMRREIEAEFGAKLQVLFNHARKRIGETQKHIAAQSERIVLNRRAATRLDRAVNDPDRRIPQGKRNA